MDNIQAARTHNGDGGISWSTIEWILSRPHDQITDAQYRILADFFMRPWTHPGLVADDHTERFLRIMADKIEDVDIKRQQVNRIFSDFQFVFKKI